MTIMCDYCHRTNIVVTHTKKMLTLGSDSDMHHCDIGKEKFIEWTNFTTLEKLEQKVGIIDQKPTSARHTDIQCKYWLSCLYYFLV